MKFEYKVISAPKKGLRGKGVRGSDDRFANALMEVMNKLGAEGWEYQRTDTLPVEARAGLTGKATQFQNMMVFRREITDDIIADDMIAGEAAAEMLSDSPENTIEAIETHAKSNAPPLPSPIEAQVVPETGPILIDPKARG